MQYILILSLFLFSFLVNDIKSVAAVALIKDSDVQVDDVKLASHKALYGISLTSKSNGAQIVNIKGKMFYETKDACDGWVTNHQFNLRYEYADNPGMTIKSDFSTYESLNGEEFNFSTRRRRDGELYEEYRGSAQINDNAGEALFSVPDGVNYDLSNKSAMFPLRHTKTLIAHANKKNKFFKTVVFDGSDGEGPVEINSFIGKMLSSTDILGGQDIDANLLQNRAWPIRMAVFPTLSDDLTAEYEMSMIFHENGIVSDMYIDYSNFSVRQELLALEAVEAPDCGADSADRLIKKK